MFPSISRALPNTPQVTQFVATKQIIIATQSTIAFAINSIPNNNSSITVQAGDVVSATITSPQTHLEHAFFEYTIDGIPQNFAVVNVSQYTVRLNPAHANKRWYNYTSSTQDLTLRKLTGDFVKLTLSDQFIVINFDFHVILDILTTAVYFISPAGVITAKISFTNAPIGYQILKNLNLALVVTAAGELYTIDQLGATTLLPALPSATAICISYDGSRYIWAAGDGWAWKLDATNNFSLVATVAVTNKVLGIAACPGGSAAIAATDTSKLYLIDATGFTDLNHIGVGLGQPICFNNKIYIPDSSNEQILVYDCISGALVTPIATLGFSPSYTFVHSTNLYVCGNDSPDVLVFDQTLTLTSTILFFDKITWISVASGTIIASRWLTNYQLTLAPLLERIVNVKFNKRYGPITHIGSDVIVIKQLGSTVVTGYTAARTTLWVNGTKSSSQGVRGVELIDDDNVNISYRSTVPGTSQISCVIGDTAYDYQITSFVETYIPRYIDFPLGTTINPVYTLNIEMPSQMTPCTMAIEYGTLYLDGALYDGSYYVQASSLITISIPIGRPQNFGLGTVPIFTLGGQQFAVPISSFVNAAFAIIVDDQLIPGTLIKKTQVISGQAALYDFILPNYYNIDILQQRPGENAKSVVGDYYHSFGVGDELSVEFTSSTKLYDTAAVYILGPTNYKFIAENSPPILFDTLTYNPVIAPYTRAIDQVLEGSVEITGGGAQNYIPGTQFTPTIQFTTPTYPVTTSAAINSGSLEFLQAGYNYLHYQNSLFRAIGNFTIEFWARPSLAGVSSAQCFMLVMGVEAMAIGQMGIYLDNGIPTLFLYDTAANVTTRTPVIIQPVLPGQQPGLPGPSLVQNTWYHIAVSRNGATLQFFIDGIKTTDNISYSTVIGNSDMYIGDSSQVLTIYPNSKNWDGQLTDIRYVRGIAVYTTNFIPSKRPLTANQPANINGTPSAAIATVTNTILLLGAHKNATYMVDSSSYSNTVIDLLQPAFSTETPYLASISANAVLTIAGGDAHLIIDGTIAVGTNIIMTGPNGQTATIQNAVLVSLGSDIALARNVQSYYDGSITVVQNLIDIEGTFAEFVIAEWGIVNQILNGVVHTIQGAAIQSAASAAIPSNENVNNITNSICALDVNPLVLSNNLIEFTVENVQTVPSSTHEWYQATTMTPPSSTHEWFQATTMTPPSSTHEWFQATTMTPPSSTHEWYQATTMVPNSATIQFIHETVFTPKSSAVEFIHETVFTPKSSAVEFIHETVFTPKSSAVEFIHETVFTPKSSAVEFIHETVFTPKSSAVEFIHETVFTPKSSAVEFIHETVFIPKSSAVEFIHETVFTPKSSAVEFIHENTVIYKSNLAFKPIQHLLFDKRFNSKEINTFFLSKTFQINTYVPHGHVEKTFLVLSDLNGYLYLKSDYNKFVLADELPVHMDYNKFVLADELHVHMDYNKFVLADERRTPLDYDRFVLADELHVHMDYNKFVLADERRTPLDYDRFVLADTSRTLLDYDRFVLANASRTLLDYDRFVGDTYTIVPLLYNKEIQDAGSLIFADIRREDIIHYIFLPMPITPMKYSSIVNDMVYNSSKPIAFREIYPEYKSTEFLENTTVHLDYKPALRLGGGTVKSVYEQDLSLPSASIKAVYEQDLSLPVASIKAVYEQDLSLPVASIKAVYEQDLSLPLVSAKGVYGALSNKLYVSEKLVYEQEFGVVWDQQIDTDATVFLTADDAETTAASDGYEFYSPYPIYDTNYYSYRVLVDTALVCKLPKGRYPIAWLLHGG